MTAVKSLTTGLLGVVAALTLSTSQASGYTDHMKVAIEVWNDARQDLTMTYASWVSDADRRQAYFIASENAGVKFDVNLPDPKDGHGVFRYAGADGKKCEFNMAHRAKFSWVGLWPNNEKSASGRSIGATPAECSASVVRGHKSLRGYSVKFSMK